MTSKTMPITIRYGWEKTNPRMSEDDSKSDHDDFLYIEGT